MDIHSLPSWVGKVLQETKAIPRGKVTTYKVLAKKTGLHPRVVGMALKRNPFPLLIPCHRVVATDGSLKGYAGNHTDRKRDLLQKEGIHIVDGKVSKRDMISAWK